MRVNIQCNNGHQSKFRGEIFDAVMNWSPNIRCEQCGETTHWFGSRRPPKATDAPSRYEVLYVAHLENDGPQGEDWREDGILTLCDGLSRPRRRQAPHFPKSLGDWRELTSTPSKSYLGINI